MSGTSAGALAFPVAAAAQPRRIVAATYNIHSCFGTDRRYSPERVAAVLAELDADIVGLQEVGTRLSVGRGLDQGAFLAGRLNYHIVVGPNIAGHRGHFGNALLSRWPVATSRAIDLTVSGREPRGAVDAHIQLPGGGALDPVRAIVTHFGLSGLERRRQIASLRQLIQDDIARRRILIVMGDFNEWFPWGPVSRTLKRATGCATRAASFPARWPLLPLDRICGNGIGLSESPRRHVSALARVASDHLPVRAVFTLPARPTA